MRYDELHGKIAVVTGAGNNLGRAIALSLAGQGCRVAVCDIDAQAAAQTCDAARQSGGVAFPFVVDVSRLAAMAPLFAALQTKFGRIDIMVNNAGVTQVGRPRLAEVEEALFDRIIAVNLKGVWLGMKHALPLMRAQGGGCIVNIASVMGLVAEAGVAIYAASKHGVIALTKAAALEYGAAGIRINAVCPSRQDGAMLNPDLTQADIELRRAGDRIMNPASGRAGRPEEIAATVLFLCSDGAANIHGASIAVDGGYTAR